MTVEPGFTVRARSNPDYSWRPRLGPWQAVPEPDSVTDNRE